MYMMIVSFCVILLLLSSKRPFVWNIYMKLIDGLMPVNISDCIFCHCSVLKKYGTRHNKSGSIQRFLCGNCKRTFSINIGFEKMKHNPRAVTTAMQLYFSGESLRNTQKSLRL